MLNPKTCDGVYDPSHESQNRRCGDYIDVYGVRISPAQIIFRDGFEGRVYKRKFSIQNIGERRVFVRLIPPSSVAYKIKQIKGVFLSPGLQVVREVTFTYNHIHYRNMLTLKIIIDQNKVYYPLSARSSYTQIRFSPKCIDFGSVDVNYASKVRTLTLKNDGSKAVRFYADCTKKDHQLIMEPTKGLLPSKSSKTIHVRIISNVIGPINLEIWVKCEQAFVVPVIGTVITPLFVPLNLTKASNMAVVDFPVTYIGVKSIQTVFVRNDSDTEAMFCFFGEINNKVLDLKTCRDDQEEFQSFDVFPRDGIAESKEVKVLYFQFAPVAFQEEKLRPFHFAIFRIYQIRCKYLPTTDHETNNSVDTDSCVAALPTISGSCILEKGVESSSMLARYSWEEPEYILSPPKEKDYLKFYIHGIPERAAVTVVPDQIVLDDLIMGSREIRVLELKNRSARLPIIIAYKKVPYIAIEKPHIFLKPLERIQVSVFVNVYRLGSIQTAIKFNLLFYDQPKVNDEYKLVGSLTVPVKLNVKDIMKLPPLHLNQKMSPPNLTVEKNRRLQHVICREFDSENNLIERRRFSVAIENYPKDLQEAKLPGGVFLAKYSKQELAEKDDEFVAFNEKFRIDSCNYYTDYVRKQAAKHKFLHDSRFADKIADYSLTNLRKLLNRDITLHKIGVSRVEPVIDHKYVIGLTPSQMKNVIVQPTILRIGPIAPYHSYQFKITVTNNNPFWIRICTKCNSNIVFPCGNTKNIKEHSEFELNAAYYAQSLGYCTTNFDVIVNECIVFVVTVIAEVCHGHLHLSKKYIEFTDQNTQEFFAINNFINADITYNFVLPTDSFQISPIEGVVKPFKSQMCHITYVPNTDCPSEVEAEFYSYKTFSQYLRLSMKIDQVKPSFIPEEVVFENIPLNLPVERKVMIVNRNRLLMGFKIVNSDFSKYMEVHPTEGVIPANSHVTITITVTLPCCVVFSTALKVIACKCKSNSLMIKGNVVYPDIAMSPKTLKFINIPASSMSVLPFSLTNNTETRAMIRFDMTGINDLSVYRSKYRWESSPVTEEVELPSQTTINFYLHFAPLDTTCDSFILPVIINRMLGPVTDEITTNQVSYFIKEIVPDCYFIEVPERVPCIKVKTFATASKLCFPKEDISLRYSYVPNWNKSNYELRICNNQHNTEDFCIRTGHVTPPLRIEYLRGKKVVRRKNAFICSLSEHEEVVFNITFTPHKPGLYKTYMPLILKSDAAARSHNFFTIRAKFQPPIIKCDSPMVYLQPLPLKAALACSKRFTLLYHAQECVVQSRTEATGVIAEIFDPMPNYESRTVIVNWQLEPSDGNLVSVDVIISCSCSVEYEVHIRGVTENCLLTNYPTIHSYIPSERQYLIHQKALGEDNIKPPQHAGTGRFHTKKNSSITLIYSQDTILHSSPSLHSELDNLDELYEDYPAFPAPDRKISKFVQGCVSAVEEWLRSQVFYGSTPHTVPDTIHLVRFQMKTPKQEKSITIPYMQVLRNLAGKQIENYVDATLHSFSDIDKAVFCYKTYNQAIQFLSAIGAYFPHVQPELLLEYSTYCVHFKNCYQSGREQMLDPDEFYRLSKQCWLDLLLQTYKIFVLNTLCQRTQQSRSKCPLHEKYKNSSRTSFTIANLFNDTELVLLNWLNFNYMEIRIQYWSDNPFLQDRNIMYFNRDMGDGFVFAAVTLAYCPYLQQHFKILCPTPVSYEDALHNNITLLEAWKLLNLSIQVTPQILVQSHSMTNLMISAYLYEVLPEMYPFQSMQFHCGLSETHTVKFNIKNVNDFPVCYKPIFIGVSDMNFGTDRDFYVIPPKNKCSIDVSYTAKFAREDDCVLVLSGECPGYHYAKSKVINLHGTLNVSYLVTTITFSSEQYTSGERTFNLKSPYNTGRKTSYSIQFTPTDCQTIEDVNSVPFQTDVSNMSVFRLFPLDAELECDEDGVGALNTLCCVCFSKEVRTVFYFKNSSVGCFAVAIISKVRQQSPYCEIIDIAVPKMSKRPSSKRTSKIIYMKIPCKNQLMWDTMIQALSNTHDKEKEFLHKLAKTTAGVHIMQKLIVIKSLGFDYNPCENSSYLIRADNASVKLPKYADMKNGCLPELIYIPFKLDISKPLPENFTFELIAANGYEVRHCRTNFVYDQSSEEKQCCSKY